MIHLSLPHNQRKNSMRLVSFTLTLTALHLASCFNPITLQQHSTRLKVTSALEGLIVENDDAATISWFDPTKAPTAATVQTIPLYPLPAVYLPTGQGTTYTLNNIEPRNVQMALDATRFCAVLRTIDTGRMASTGTILRIVHQDNQILNGEIRRITLTCVAEEVVDILAILNPKALELPYRLKHPREYLCASVGSRLPSSDEAIHTEELRTSIVHDFNAVRDMLLEGIGIDKLPLACRDGFWLPELSMESLNDESSFWEIAFLWQTLCNSFQEGHRSNLVNNRNEMLVAAAIAKKSGPLNLPIQLSDLDRSDRDAIAAFEIQAQKEWVEFGMNPVIDFAILLQENSRVQRLRYFGSMVRKARENFERLANEDPVKATPILEITEEPKGAWFDDSLW